MRIEESTRRCPYCGADEEYILGGGDCNCNLQWMEEISNVNWNKISGELRYLEFNSIDNALEDMRNRSTRRGL